MREPWDGLLDSPIDPRLAAMVAEEWDRYWEFTQRDYQNDAGVRQEAVAQAARLMRATTPLLPEPPDDATIVTGAVCFELADGYVLRSRTWPFDERNLAFPRAARLAKFMRTTRLEEWCRVAGHPISLGWVVDSPSPRLVFATRTIDPVDQARMLRRSLDKYREVIRAVKTGQHIDHVFEVRHEVQEWGIRELAGVRSDYEYMIEVVKPSITDIVFRAIGVSRHLAAAWFLVGTAPSVDELSDYLLYDDAAIDWVLEIRGDDPPDDISLNQWMAQVLGGE